MNKLIYVLKNFFTNKVFLDKNMLIGTMFTPLHFIISALILTGVIWFAASLVKKKNNSLIKKVFIIIWLLMVILEITKITWETLSNGNNSFEWAGILPLYPCSVIMYALPFAIWGKGHIKNSACGYVCTIGLIGACVNFFYPATILPNYSIISFAGFHTFFYHGSMLFIAIVMIFSKYHGYNFVKKWWELFLPSIPLLIVSIIANIVNFSKINSDYMFFKGKSFIFYDIFKNTPPWFPVIFFYFAYLVIPALFYLPMYIKNKNKDILV